MSPHQVLIRFILYAGCTLNYHKVINDFVAKTKDLRKFELMLEDWSTIELVCRWLKAFHSATTQMSTTKRSMLSSTQAIFRGLQESLQDSLRTLPNNAPSRLKNSLIKSHWKLSDYYTKFDDSLYYIWSSCESFFVSSTACMLQFIFLSSWSSHIIWWPHVWLRWQFDNAATHGACKGTTTLILLGQLCEGPVPPPPATQPAVTEKSGWPMNFTVWYKKCPSAVKDEHREFYKLPWQDFDTCDPI